MNQVNVNGGAIALGHHGFCLYQRPGACHSHPDYSINDVIAERRE